MNFTPNLIVGVVITLVGVVLTLDRLGVADASTLFRFWPVALTFFGLSVIVQAFRRGPADAGAGPQPRPVLSPGLVIVMVVGWLFLSNAGQFRANGATESSEDAVNLVGVMSRVSRTSRATQFSGANMLSIMGRTELDLRNATPVPGGEAAVDVLGVMGTVVLVVPEGWVVDMQVAPLMGRVRDLRPPAQARAEAPADAAGPPPAAPPRVLVRGFMMMGGLVIRS